MDNNYKNLLDIIYPIGSIYLTSDINANPMALFGGYWNVVDYDIKINGQSYDNEKYPKACYAWERVSTLPPQAN